MKETELAQKFVEYLSCYDLYFEVDHRSGVIDIVALDGKISMAVEVKTSFNFKVLEQASSHRPYFNYSYIAVPFFRNGAIQEQLCKDYGIGLLLYSTGYYSESSIREKIKPKLNRVSSTKLIERLSASNKAAIPGAKNGESGKVTAFRITVDNAVDFVRRYPGCTLRELSNGISHHYRSNELAKSSIYNWIRSGVIKELKIENRKVFINQ